MKPAGVAAVLFAAVLAAQTTPPAPAKEPPAPPAPAAPGARLLVRQSLVDARSLEAGRSLGQPGYVRDSTWCGGDLYTLADTTIDVAAAEVLGASADKVWLAPFAGAPRWLVARAAVHAAVPGTAAQRLLLGARVVLPREGGGLVGLDRKTGALLWQAPAAPNELVVADDDGVLAAGTVGAERVFVRLAAANGAFACRNVLPGPATRLVPGPRGLAAVLADRALVFDRAGPKLCELPGAFVACTATPDGWCAATAEGLVAWNAAGEVLWRVAAPLDDLDGCCLAATAAGDVVACTWGRISDSGFVARACRGADGTVRWEHTDHGLGVAHSKYWHRLTARPLGDSLVVVSQAAGGDFAVVLDAADGARRARVTFGH